MVVSIFAKKRIIVVAVAREILNISQVLHPAQHPKHGGRTWRLTQVFKPLERLGSDELIRSPETDAGTANCGESR
jgi:hypothetical protein